ncbi:hypothetical protein L1887_39101 [Cichorium endivia]|nr:hypothetical protein L1887_39101 [Cichorium endivia]
MRDHLAKGPDANVEDVRGQDDNVADLTGPDAYVEDVRGQDDNVADLTGPDPIVEDVRGQDDKVDDPGVQTENVADLTGPDANVENVRGQDDKVDDPGVQVGKRVKTAMNYVGQLHTTQQTLALHSQYTSLNAHNAVVLDRLRKSERQVKLKLKKAVYDKDGRGSTLDKPVQVDEA